MTEDERYSEAMAERTPKLVLANVRRLLNRPRKRMQNWVLALEVFGMGSTFARRICVDAGLDPEAYS